METKQLAWDYLKAFLLKPYEWGGDDFSGIDCSGLVVEWHKSLGLVKNMDDFSAQSLWEFYKKYPGRPLDFGTLLFWGKTSQEIVHVTIALNKDYMVGAEGGTAAIKMPMDAARANAFVKVRPISFRGVPIAVAHPPYPWG